jgi:hypothetical protein
VDAPRTAGKLSASALKGVEKGGGCGKGRIEDMPDAPVALIAILAAVFLVVSFVIRTWWRGVKLSFFIFAIVLFVIAFFVYTAQHR